LDLRPVVSVSSCCCSPSVFGFTRIRPVLSLVLLLDLFSHHFDSSLLVAKVDPFLLQLFSRPAPLIFPRARCRKPCAGPVFFAQVSRSGIPIPAGRCAGRVHRPCLISFFCVVLLLLVHSTGHRSDSSARPLLPRRTQSSSCSIFSGVSSQSVFWLLFPVTLGLASSSLRYCVWSRWFCFCPAHAEVSIWTPVAVSDSVLKQDIFVAACVALDVCR
jgi:hypothetical protein